MCDMYNPHAACVVAGRLCRISLGIASQHELLLFCCLLEHPDTVGS